MTKIQLQAAGDKHIKYDLLEKDTADLGEDVEVRDRVVISYDGEPIEKSIGGEVAVNFTLNIDLTSVGLAALYFYDKFKDSDADLTIEDEEIEDLSKETIEEALQEQMEDED